MTHRRQFEEVGEDLDLDAVLENDPAYARESAEEDDNEGDYDAHQSEASDSEEEKSRDWRGKLRHSTLNSPSKSPEQEESEEQNGDLEDMQDGKPIMLHVGNLHFNKVTANTLKDVFSPYGKISRINLVRDSAKGRSRGFAFVVMENPEDAKQAMNKLNRSMLAGRTIKVSVAKAPPKSLDDNQEDDNSSKKRTRDLRERLNLRGGTNKRARIDDIPRPPLLSSSLAGRLGGLGGNLQSNSLQGLLDSPLDTRSRLPRPGGGLLPYSAGMAGGIQGMPLKDPNKVIWEWQEGAMPSGASHMSSLNSPAAGLMRNRHGGVGGAYGRMQLEEYRHREYEDYDRRQFEQLGRQQLGVMGRGDERDILRSLSRHQGRYDDPRQAQAQPLGAEDERALTSIKARAALAGSILRSLLPGESSQKPSSSMMDDPPMRVPQTQQSPWAYQQSRRSGPLLEDPVIRSRLPEPPYPRSFSPPRLEQRVVADRSGIHIPFRDQERHRGYSSGVPSAPVLNDPVLQQMARARSREHHHPYAMPSGISSRW